MTTLGLLSKWDFTSSKVHADKKNRSSSDGAISVTSFAWMRLAADALGL